MFLKKKFYTVFIFFAFNFLGLFSNKLYADPMPPPPNDPPPPPPGLPIDNYVWVLVLMGVFFVGYFHFKKQPT